MKLLALIESVLQRPYMYTMSGTYGEVVGFLTGYYSGIAKNDIYNVEVVAWADFRQWLQGKIGSEMTPALHQLVNEEQALNRFEQLFRNWQEEHVKHAKVLPKL